MALLDKLPNDKICFAGDLIDRGPKSAQVIEFVRANGHDCVRGNHEQMMIDHYNKVATVIWRKNGGIETLTSYNNDILLFEEHVKWLETLPFYKEYPKIKDSDRHLVVSHANITKFWSSHIRNTDYFNTYAMWNRGTPLDSGEIYNIHGHTPQINGPTVKSFFANVDTGAVFKVPEFGTLTALQFPEMVVFTQDNIDL